MTETDFLRLVHKKFEEYSILMVYKKDRLGGSAPFLISLSAEGHVFRTEGHSVKQCFTKILNDIVVKTRRSEDEGPHHAAADRRRR